MIWYLMSMTLGALVFASGIVFERLTSCEKTPDEAGTQKEEEMNYELYRQWENLLGYDGTKQEERYDEDR